MQAAYKFQIINHCHGLRKTACYAVVADKLNEMRKEKTITAYGLKKGRRKECPHCKGRGWIPKADVETSDSHAA